MARTCSGTVSVYLSNGTTPPVTSGVGTVACWVKTAALTVDQLIAYFNNVSGANYRAMRIVGGTGQIGSASDSAGGIVESRSSSGVSIGVWAHAAATWNSGSSRFAFLNGAKGTDAGGTESIAVDRFAIGAIAPAGGTIVAEMGLWNAVLTDGEVLALAKGFAPSVIRPQSLVGYWPLFGNDSPEPDRSRSRYDLTLVSTPAKADHPPIIYPAEGSPSW